MHLSDDDLRQLDEAALAELTPEQAQALLGKALADLKAAREKLVQEIRSTARGHRAHWPRGSRARRRSRTRRRWRLLRASTRRNRRESRVPSARRGNPGVRWRARDRSRPPSGPTQVRTGAQPHPRTSDRRREGPRAARLCPDAGALWAGPTGIGPTTPATCWILCLPPAAWWCKHTKHIYLETPCPCGHWSQALTQRMRLSRAKVREFLIDWLGVSLSTALINQCVHEAARALDPVVEQEILETGGDVE